MNKGVFRIFVEKKPGFDTESQFLNKEIKEFLGIKGLTAIRVIHRYDIEGISDDIYNRSRETIFAEPPVDLIYDGDFEITEDARFIAVEYLPGQYDQRADSAAQCIQILTHGEKPEVRCAKIILISGEITDKEFQKIKDYCINPLESREASLAKPKTLKMELEYPTEVKEIDDFIKMNKDELLSLHQELELAMSDADLLFTQNYFKKERRNPALTEIRVLDTYWSDHCRHTTFLTEITDIEFRDGPYTPAIKKAYQQYLDRRKRLYGDQEKPICLMDIATIGMKEMSERGLLDDLDKSEEINACSIKIKVDIDGQKEDWLLMFKNETHNHPTEIEPFGGAATCLGGAIRDPLSGRSYVYQAMRVTGSADPRQNISATMEGKLPQRKISTGAAEGYSSYGNQIGLATGHVAELYHENFIAKRMEIGAVLGAAPAENVIRERPQKGDIIILLGGRTGRDGCGGATGSSKEHTEESLHSCGAEVQKGNPITERKIQRLFRNPDFSKLIKRCNDFGAGGVSVAIGELADSLDIDLDAVPKKYEGLDGTELAISESQERMAVVIAQGDLAELINIAEEENLEATPVAVVTDTGRLRMTWQDKTIVDISRDFLNTHGAAQQSSVTVISADTDDNYLTASPVELTDYQDIQTAWFDNLQDLNVCSQKGLVERFDSTIGAASILLPFGGKYQMTPVDGMAAKIPVLKGETNTATVMTFGYNPKLASWSPFHGAVYAVVQAVARAVALGTDYKNIRLTFQEYFEKLGQDRTRWGKPFSALLGAYLVQSSLGIPAIGGKDSMSGTFKDIDVPPTLLAFAVNVSDVKHIISPEFKSKDSKVVWVRIKKDKDSLPVFEDLKEKYAVIHNLIKEGKVRAAKAVDEGGVAAAVSKMTFGNQIGFDFKENINIKDLFLPEFGSLVLELSPQADLSNLSEYILLGSTSSDSYIRVEDEELDIIEAQNKWQEPLEGIFPTRTKGLKETPPLKINRIKEIKKSSVKITKPGVFIPVFPGTNCEYDTIRKFEEAGARVESFVFKNLTPKMIDESIEKMVEMIDESQILMISGGFSAGDEPEGSGKFIANVFRNPLISESLMRLLNERDGLILGICNGFQALIKLGLLPYGEICDINSNSPTLSYNTIGRHVSSMVRTRVVSNVSPWLARVQAGAEHIIPVSHGEGRFIASDELLKDLLNNGQIATQYVDFKGKPTQDNRFNPNGSCWSVEGITSPDGRIFGKMGHSERITSNTAKNIPGEKDQQLFRAGVEYFM
ncbi:phosphoribosylformylglycinamidine synthase [Iocasia frigidifontis]|uniref:Phosphoribosylformylglycinamidine synthase n=1 Tax=Iocasia fonsfrigidae TaxID=2682810 RepID=A0A8A7KAF5_9FIRM|nr:phosphoribosylformylglycinamidine synthase [Iocasia fonsfrigidae]QTL98441.1 phosphoribosylformylglycinamidine synthase [Iocasia fonsfrigidae]